MLPKIMIVDNDINMLEMYSDIIKSQGYQVVTESDGKKSFDSIIKEDPDILLLDIMMPKINGLHILDVIKSNPETCKIKVIMLTAMSDEKMKIQAQKYGACDYLVKSETTLSEVLKRIDNAVSRCK